MKNTNHLWLVALFIFLQVHLFIQQTRKKAHNILEDRNQLLRSPGSISKVKCTANRFRASLESGAIWRVSSMINEKSGLILGLIDCVSHPSDMAFLVLCTTSVDSRLSRLPYNDCGCINAFIFPFLTAVINQISFFKCTFSSPDPSPLYPSIPLSSFHCL